MVLHTWQGQMWVESCFIRRSRLWWLAFVGVIVHLELVVPLQLHAPEHAGSSRCRSQFNKYNQPGNTDSHPVTVCMVQQVQDIPTVERGPRTCQASSAEAQGSRGPSRGRAPPRGNAAYRASCVTTPGSPPRGPHAPRPALTSPRHTVHLARKEPTTRQHSFID